MSEVLLPPWIIPEKEEHEWLDEGSSVFASAFAPGLAQRQSYGGMRLRLKRRHTVRGEEKAVLLSVLKQTRGRFNALRTKVHFALRGTGFGSELLTNNTFGNGTTGWATNENFFALTVADRILRSTRIAQDGITHFGVQNTNTSGLLTQYAAYLLRMFVQQGRGTPPSFELRLGSTGAGEYGTSLTTGFGLKRLAAVALGTAGHVNMIEGATGAIAGDYHYVPYISLSKCGLVDNGLNSLLQSDEFDTSWTAARASVDDQSASVNAPDGSATADSIIEDSTGSNTHLVAQQVNISSSAADYSFGVALKAGARTWAQLVMTETTGLTSVSAYFNLSTGAVGGTTTGTNFTNVRTFVVALGDDWYACWVVGRKTNSATTINVQIRLATGDGSSIYSGDGTSNIYAWRATLVQSGVPTRLVQTTTSASTGTSQTGNALYVKGLPASTNGLLLPGDWFEINGELKQATAALNSDAAGLGYLQFEPALVRSPANDDPVIVTDPMGKFLVSNIRIENEFGTQAVVTYDLEHIYE